MYLALQMCLQPIYAVLRAYMKRYVQLSLFGESSREEKGRKGRVRYNNKTLVPHATPNTHMDFGAKPALTGS